MEDASLLLGIETRRGFGIQRRDLVVERLRRSSLASTEPLQRHVPGDPEDPRRESRVSLEPSEAAMNTQEDLLCCVLGVVGPDESDQDAVDRSRIEIDDLPERSRVAGGRASD